VVEEKTAEGHSFMKSENNNIILGSGSRLPVAAQPSSDTTTIQCPECGSQRLWKDGMRYEPYGEIQRYLCRNCAHRFSFSQGSEHSEHLQKLQTLILKTKADKTLLCRVVDERVDSCKELDSTQQMKHTRGRRATVLLTGRAKKLAIEKTRTQEKAAGATTSTSLEIARGQLIDCAFKMKKKGLSDITIKNRVYRLETLIKRGADLQNPDSVLSVLALSDWSPANKHVIAETYQSYAKTYKIIWEKPKYRVESKTPFIPLESEIDQLIAGCGKKTATFLQVSKDTGARSGEVARLQWKDVDEVRNVIRINNPEKGSRSREIKVSPKTIAMLNALPKKSDKVFTRHVDGIRNNFLRQRNRLARQLQNPRIHDIHFHTLRHWKATMEFHRTKNIVHVKQLLGHKRLESTDVYTHLISFESDEWNVAHAQTLDEENKLIEAGFEFIRFSEKDNVAIYRKRK
jgi:integrase/transposase-like protein